MSVSIVARRIFPRPGGIPEKYAGRIEADEDDCPRLIWQLS
jgi:hypothetical protein